MDKFYRLLAFIFVVAFGISSFFLMVFQQDIRDYLSSMNNLNVKEPLIERPVPAAFDPKNNPLDTTLLDNAKYKALIKSEVDMTGIKLPGTESSSTPTSTPIIKEEPLPDFKVGNPSPFKSF